MKLHICFEHAPLTGYLNVSPSGREDVSRGDPLSLGAFVDPAECTEILTHDLHRFTLEEVKKALPYWYSLLVHKGILYLSFLNFREISRDFSEGRLGVEDLHKLKVNAMLSPAYIRALLEGVGLRVKTMELKKNVCHICAERP